MQLGLPGTVWAVLCIEFVERLGYYAVAFSLFTYCTVMLRTGPELANALINIVYILIPAAAFLASGIADSSVGRPRVLAGALVLYTLALFLLFLSACPFMYVNFPEHARDSSKALFAISLVCFSAGYGSMKVCTNPIMADCVVLHYRGCGVSSSGAEDGEGQRGAWPQLAEAHADDSQGERASSFVKNSEGVTDVADEKTAAAAAASAGVYGAINGGHAALVSASPTDNNNNNNSSIAMSDAFFDAQLEAQALSRLFIYAYWIANVGGLVGSFVAPLLRNWESARIDAGSETHTTGYYYSFLLAALSVGIGGLFLCRCYYWLPRNAPAPNYVLVRVLAVALRNRWGVWRGSRRFVDPAAPPPRDWLEYACAEVYPVTMGNAEVTVEGEWDAVASSSPPSSSPAHTSPSLRERGVNVYSADSVTTAAWVADCRATLQVCKAFVALPIYWLLCNQFSTNLMYQAAALNLPPSIPEELFNNINTVTMLVFLAVWDQWIVPRLLQHRVPTARLRIVAGFTCMCASMLWCGFLQCAITGRGSYDTEESYVLHEGQQKLSAAWLIMPYVLQGFSSAFVDPTVMEVAYRDAPARMKGTVMGLYWVASSASGFLGLVLSPVMKPQNATALFFSFAVAQMVVSGLFFFVNRDRAY